MFALALATSRIEVPNQIYGVFSVLPEKFASLGSSPMPVNTWGENKYPGDNYGGI